MLARPPGSGDDRKQANLTGQEFEKRVADRLNWLVSRSNGRAVVEFKPKLQLQSGEIVRPDADLLVELPHELSYYLIECQKRQKFEKPILHKIRYMKDKSARNTAMFVYSGNVSDEYRASLQNEGVMVRSFEEFDVFIRGLSLTLACAEPVMTYLADPLLFESLPPTVKRRIAGSLLDSNELFDPDRRRREFEESFSRRLKELSEKKVDRGMLSDP